MDYDADHHDDGTDHDYLNWVADIYDDSAGDHYYDVTPAVNVDHLLNEPRDNYKPRHADERPCSDDICHDLDSTHLYECHFEPVTDYIGKHRNADDPAAQLKRDWFQHRNCYFTEFLTERTRTNDDCDIYADGYLAGFNAGVYDRTHADCYGCETDDGICYADKQGD